MDVLITRTSLRGISATITATAVALGGAGLRAQQPILNVAGPGAPVRRIVLQLDPTPAAPEPPQNNPSPPVLKDDLFAGTEKFARNATEATEVNMDPDSLDLVGGNEAHKAHRMVLNVVRSYSYDKAGMYNMADVEEFRHKLEIGDWHCSVHTRDLKTGESTDICSRRRAPDMIENAIITVAPRELTFIHTIRKANGQGGGLSWDGVESLSSIPGVPLEAAMAALGPELQAEMLASTALLRAEMPAFAQELRQSQLGKPGMPRHPSREHWHFGPSPEEQKLLNELGEQFDKDHPLPQP